MSVSHRFFNVSYLKSQFYTGFSTFFCPKLNFTTFLISNLTASDPLSQVRIESQWFRCDSPGPYSQVRIEWGRWSLENRSNPYVFQQISFLIAVLHGFFNMSKLKYQFYICFLTFLKRDIDFTQVFAHFRNDISLLHRFFSTFLT